MLDNPNCPVCDEISWKVLETRPFVANDETVDPFTARRLRVLFEVWRPGETRFVANTVRCGTCGFVCFTPRPTSQELDAKYQFLTGQLDKKRTVAKISDLDRRRSEQVFEALKPYLKEGTELLDYGGGRGGLLASFLDFGVRCSLVDYSISLVPGVEKVGKTLDEMAPNRRFDVVISSHVFEHLADPLDTAWRLRRVLRADGILFVEVPLQTANGPPNYKSPVTHVNFFEPESLRVLLQRAGYDVLRCETEKCLFAKGVTRRGVRAIARVPKPLEYRRNSANNEHPKQASPPLRNERAGRGGGVRAQLRRRTRPIRRRLRSILSKL